MAHSSLAAALLVYQLSSLLLSSQTSGQLPTLPNTLYGKIEAGAHNELYDWRPPDDVRKKYPWHIMGFDKDGRVVFLNEVGKWDFEEIGRNYARGTDLALYNFDRALQTLADLALEPLTAPNGTKYGPRGSAFISDWAGLDISILRVTSPQVLVVAFEMFSKLANIDDFLAYGFYVNLNGLAQALLRSNIVPNLPVLNKVFVYGTNTTEYNEALQKLIPLDQLPPRYGGYQNFSYIASFGTTFNHNLNN